MEMLRYFYVRKLNKTHIFLCECVKHLLEDMLQTLIQALSYGFWVCFVLSKKRIEIKFILVFTELLHLKWTNSRGWLFLCHSCYGLMRFGIFEQNY